MLLKTIIVVNKIVCKISIYCNLLPFLKVYLREKFIMKNIFFISLFVLVQFPGYAEAQQTIQLKEKALSDTKIDYSGKISNTNTIAKVAVKVPTIVTNEDAKLWTKPVNENPNFHKPMPLRDPNAPIETDNE